MEGRALSSLSSLVLDAVLFAVLDELLHHGLSHGVIRKASARL